MLAFSPFPASEMEDDTEISLHNFFVFNSTFGPNEGEEENKILFYYPPNTNIDKQIRTVGLCEAICKFTSTFTDKDTESLHTQKKRQLFYQPEPNFWLIMTVGVPHSKRRHGDQEVTVYREDDVQDSVYLAVLKQAYQMFKLFNGTIQRILDELNMQGLKTALSKFFTKYISSLKLAHCDIVDVFDGIHFLPLDKNTYLRIQCFINQLEAAFPVVHSTAFLYNQQLVWSGLEQEDMRTMYRYLTTTLLPKHMEQTFQQSGAGPSLPSSTQHYGRFILGPSTASSSDPGARMPRVYVRVGESSCTACYLAVYRCLSATICLLLSSHDPLDSELMKRLDQYMGPSTSRLASDIGEQYSRPERAGSVGGGEAQYKYVYFNHMNLAQKTTIHGDNRRAVGVTPDIMRIVADLNQDMQGATSVREGETAVKTATDMWVVGKKSDEREFYVVLGNKQANLADINEEIKRLCTVQFSNIFFLD